MHAPGHEVRRAGTRRPAVGWAVGGARGARAPDREADAGAQADGARRFHRAAGTGEPVCLVPRVRRGGRRPSWDRPSARAGRARGRGDSVLGRPSGVALPAGRARMAARGGADRGPGVRCCPSVGHRGRRSAARVARRVHRVPVAPGVPQAAGITRPRQDSGCRAGAPTAGTGRSGVPPQRPRTHIQISAAAVSSRALDVTQSPSKNCMCWYQASGETWIASM
jgi:hypothetical protein